MDTALIVVIVAVALLLLFVVARRAWARSLEARREKAGELRVEATQKQEQARRAEIEAERERVAAETSARRADRLDPDVEGGEGRFSFLRRNRDEDHDEDDYDEDANRDADRETTANGDRRGLWDRLVHR